MSDNNKNTSKITEQTKNIFESLKIHLRADYRKSYIVRKIMSCGLLFFILRYMQVAENDSLFNSASILPLIWTILAWIFWHYAFWSYQGGVVDTFSQNLIHFGSIWAIIGKVLLQNVLLLFWIALIAPISGLKTWLMAVKSNSELYINTNNEM